MEDQRLDHLLAKGIKYVRLCVVDISNTTRIRIIPIKNFLELVNSNGDKGYFMANAVFGLMAQNDHLAVGLPAEISCCGELRLVPDMKKGVEHLYRLPYGSGAHAMCMVDVMEKDRPGVPFGGCARTSLKNILNTAKEEFGLSFLVGFEIEVIFLEKQLDPITPIDYTTYASSISLHSERTCMMIDEIVQSIVDQGIEVTHFHAESANGQFEFVTGPYDPLTAADNLVRTRETIYNIASKYNIKATLAPKVFADQVGTGCHCHISLHSSKENVTRPGPLAPEGMTSLEENFLAGLLQHIGSICAFILPNVTSYNRTKEGCWAGSSICWGIDNREAPIRLTYSPAVNRKFRFEIKCVDGTANPYLAVGAIIVAGLDGVRNRLSLDQKELTVGPGDLNTEEKSQLKMLPNSIEESLRVLEEPIEYGMYCKGMGKLLVDLFIAIRRSETEHMRTLTDDEQLKFVIKTY